MAYSEELKNSIMKRFKTESIHDIAKSIDISKSTLYRWKKEKEDSKEIRRLIKEEEFQEAEKMALKYLKNPIIQSQLIKIYIEQGRLGEAEKIALKYQNDLLIQSQLITIYTKQGRLDEAEEIAQKYPESLPIQDQLATIYEEKKRAKNAVENMQKYPESLPIQDQLKEIQLSKQTNEREKVLDSEYFSELRAKIVTNTLEFDDIQKFREQKEILEDEQYNIIKIAINHRSGNIKEAMKIVKSLKNDSTDSKMYNIIGNELEKKNGIFDIGKWDKWIGWDMENSTSFINKIERMKEKPPQEEIAITEKIEEPIIQENEKPTKKYEDKPKYITSNQIAVTTSNKNSNNNKNEKEETNKDQANKDETIQSKMSLTIKNVVEEISKGYYVKMREYETRNKYVDKFDKLQSILKTNSDNKRVQIELMLVLINEGYEEVVKKEFPDDYEIINEIIQQYRQNEISASIAKNQMDEYYL